MIEEEGDPVCLAEAGFRSAGSDHFIHSLELGKGERWDGRCARLGSRCQACECVCMKVGPGRHRYGPGLSAISKGRAGGAR